MSGRGNTAAQYDPDTDELVLLFNPRIDTWDEHFEMNDCNVFGLTPVGRATVALLSMNDPDRVQLRIELAASEQDQ